MKDVQIEVPLAWKQLSIDRLGGTLMVIGGTDTGKSTFARYLVQRLRQTGRHVAHLDGDPGQSVLGPPATMTLVLWPGGQTWRWFVGDISPGRHLLAVLTGAARLAQAAYKAGAEVVIYDTTGFVSAVSGGLALKLAQIDLLRPAVVFAFGRHLELESLLPPLRRSRRVRVVDLKVCDAVAQRDTLARQAYRAAQYAAYFGSAQPLRVDRRHIVILPAAPLFPGRLVALEDQSGFTMGLGIVLEEDQAGHELVLSTPLITLDGVDVVHPGDVVVDTQTFQDRRLMHDGP